MHKNSVIRTVIVNVISHLLRTEQEIKPCLFTLIEIFLRIFVAFLRFCRISNKSIWQFEWKLASSYDM